MKKSTNPQGAMKNLGVYTGKTVYRTSLWDDFREKHTWYTLGILVSITSVVTE